MPKIELVRQAHNQRAKQTSNLHDMIATPRSEAQFSATVRDLVLKLNLRGECRLLEVGCGNANLLSHLKLYVREVTGVDLADNLLICARAALPTSLLVCAETSALPFAESKFDRVLCYSVFLYFPDLQHAHRGIVELCRVCADGGLVLIGDLPDKTRRRIPAPLRWELKYRFNVLRRRHPGPSIWNPLRWQFFDLPALKRFTESLGHETQILDQPPDLLAASYRSDLLIRTKKKER